MASIHIEMKIMDSDHLKRTIKCIKRRKWSDRVSQGHPPRYCVKI